SLWDRAYDALGKDKPKVVEEYERLLSNEIQQEESLSNDPLTAQSRPSGDGPYSVRKPRRAQLDLITERGLSRIEETRTKYTIAGHEFVLKDQIAQAAGLVLWAKGWIGEALIASPEASIAWAGVCIILPLLTNPKTADDANRSGFTYVTTRMRYYSALEPLLLRLGRNSGVPNSLVVEAEAHIVDLYQHILEFQMLSVLRFYRGSLRNFSRDALSLDDWGRKTQEIQRLESAVRQDLEQTNSLVSRQELESLQATS
ncbi:hypothetical protein GQ53DRAFT_625795, partial [Thozetella sp. PMI_491]